MRGKRRGENDRAQKQGKLANEFWSKRPLACWIKSPENKKLSRRLERRKLKGQIDV